MRRSRRAQMDPALGDERANCSDNAGTGRVHHFDPSRLQPASKFIDVAYAPGTILVPATTETRRPIPGRLWHDKAASCKIEREFSERRIHFSDTVARKIDNPFLTNEMVLFDERRMYLDTSVQLPYSPELYLSAVAQRCADAIAASVDAPV